MSVPAPGASIARTRRGPQRPRRRGLRVMVVLLLVLTLLLLAAAVAVALRIRSDVFAVQEPDGPADGSTGEPLVATEEVTFPTGRGELPALFVEGRSTTWAVLVHGKGTRPEETLRLAQATVAAGLPTLAISYRNDPGVPEDPTGRHAFGQTEWRDLEAAVAYAQDEGAESVVLGGISMGGSIIAAYLESSEREAGLVRGVVLDAPVLDLAAVVDDGATRVDLPLGLQVPEVLVAAGRQVSAVLDDVDWDAVDYLDDTSWLQVPALVLHTTGDITVPISSSRELVAREPGLVRLVELEGEHAAGYTTDPERYLREVRRLLAEVT